LELGLVPALDCEGAHNLNCLTHRDDGKRFIVRGDEKLTAFLELELTVSSRSSPPPS